MTPSEPEPLPTTRSALEIADASRLELSPKLDPKRRSKLGQFMTPGRVARFMAKMFDNMPREVHLIDAGAGMGALTAAFVTEACSRDDRPASIDVTAFEVDPEHAKILRNTLAVCGETCAGAGVTFTFRVIEDDYLLYSSEPLLAERCAYNCAILNPPYAKINTGSRWRQALRSLGIETVNFYTAFVAVALQQLADGGEMVAITPRSFCNGPYYEPFRRQLLSTAALLAIHVFESRRTAFNDDDVLQENVIYHIRKGAEQSTSVRISTSRSPADNAIKSRSVPFAEVVRPNDPHAFIRLSTSAADSDLAIKIQALPCLLTDLGVKVSTGRVVDFRAREHLRKMPSDDTVPLIYPAHFDNGAIHWPLPENKKHNALADNERTERLMVSEGIYVLTKRFSAKEEKRRLVAAVYEPDQVAPGPAGFENHLNYFHEDGSGLPLVFARGLATFLNSTVVDQYFRQFSGHTQVNATDLRNLHYPSREQIEEIGRQYPQTQEEIDLAVEVLL